MRDHIIASAPLEEWLRTRYFDCRIDISSSGVHDYALGELRQLVGVGTGELDSIFFRDSPALGSERLRQAIADRYAPDSGASVMVTHGSSEALFLAVTSVLRAGDEVIVLSPAYHSLSALAAHTGAHLRVWELSPEKGFRPDLGALRELLSERTRAVIVNFPHNPTGATLSRLQYEEFLELLSKYDAYLFWDAAFADLAHGSEPLPDPSLVMDRCLSFGTLSKSYGLPGLRIGWCIGTADVHQDMVKLRDYTTISCSPLLEHLAAAAVEQAELLIAPRRAQAEHNRLLLMRWAEQNADILDLAEPGGGVTAFPRFLGIDDTTRVCSVLSEQDGVLTVPGGCFGYPEHMRIGYGGPTEDLATGLNRVAERVRSVRGRGDHPWPPKG